MARKIRIEYAGAAYHVMARGNQGRDIYADDRDRKFTRAALSTCGRAKNQIPINFSLLGQRQGGLAAGQFPPPVPASQPAPGVGPRVRVQCQDSIGLIHFLLSLALSWRCLGGGQAMACCSPMKRFCGGNLQTAGKPSLFPLSCCGTRQNTSEPKIHC